MKTGDLGSQIARELRQNPKKAAILGVMCVVALYYWVPIIQRWSSGDQKPLVRKSQDAGSSQSSPTVTSVANGVVRWEAIAAMIDEDPSMKPANVQLDWNPFSREAAAPQNESQPEADDRAEDQPTPSESGLVLQSTVIGRTRQTAVINAEALTTGDWIASPQDPALRFRLVRITLDFVELERNDQRFILKLEAEKNRPGVQSWPVAEPRDAAP